MGLQGDENFMISNMYFNMESYVARECLFGLYLVSIFNLYGALLTFGLCFVFLS